MKPNEWLELVTTHVSNPEAINDEQLASLRSNYVVWKAALEMLRSESKTQLIKATQQILNGAMLPEEDYEMLKQGAHKPDSMTDEQWDRLRIVRVQHVEWVSKIVTANTIMNFYKKFDTEFKTSTGDLPSEVQEVYWKQKHDNLLQAISNHRTAYVLANKQANGFDFLLWQEAGLGEFHASRHRQMTEKGYISFRE